MRSKVVQNPDPRRRRQAAWRWGAWDRAGLFRTLGLLFAGLALSVAALSGAARADAIKSLGGFKHWNAYYYKEDGAKVCYIASSPVTEKGDYTRRGEVFILVTHRPATKTKDVVSFQAGYSFKGATEVVVTIDGETQFRLFTEGDMAWTQDAAMDQAFVAAMQKGSRMVVVGVSKRGTKTTDSYSLAGFTASRRAIGLACDVE